MNNITTGKTEKMKLCSNNDGIIAAIAIDQRNSMREMFQKIKGSEVSDSELIDYKNEVSEVLTPYASAILLDTSFGIDAIAYKAPGTGVLLTYDRSGYAPDLDGRIPRLLPDWSVRRLVEAGADAIKVMIYYDVADSVEVNNVKHAFVERLGAECSAYDVPFFLEPMSYSDTIKDKKSFAYAQVKPEKVMGIMREFSKPQYKVDVLKVEPPIEIRYVQSSPANPDGQYAYTMVEALNYFKLSAEQTSLPFIYLSAGVTTAAFHEILKMAGDSGANFSGILCGRTTWQGGIAHYYKGGTGALRTWLSDEGVRIISELNDDLKKYAVPWFSYKK